MLDDTIAIVACWVTTQTRSKAAMTIYLRDLDPCIQVYKKEKIPEGMGIIYALVRKTNRKAYIGQTIDSLRQRLSRHKHGSGKQTAVCPAIHNAIKKHGIGAFDVMVLCLCSRNELDDKEVELIAQHRTTEKEFGYNIAIGGAGNGGLPQEVRENIQKKRKVTMATEESKAKRSKSAKTSWADASTREIRRERSEAKMLKMVEEAKEIAVPIPPPHLRKHNAVYIRNGKYYRFYVPVGRPLNRGNLKEISIEAIEAKRKESRERMAIKRASV